MIEGVGSGGMAEVYRARDDLLGREVAVKVLSQRFSKDAAFIERFRREAQAAANLNHPNIVSLYDYGSEPDANFIVMEFIDGKTLAEIISEEGPLLPERAASIARDVAEALTRAHAAGLVHRDIKSANIMLNTAGQTKVTDFGIARALGTSAEATMTQTGMVIGTAAYLSPEQAQGNPVDARSDVYSLGCVLHEMLTGSAPFTGDTPLSIAYKHVRETAPRPSSLNPDVPAPLDAITMKAMAKNPDNRYASAAEMSHDLQRFLSGHQVEATPLLAGDTMVATRAAGTQVLHETAYEDELPSRRGGMYLLVALGLLILFGLIAFFVFDNLVGNNVTVPNVRGKTEEQARSDLDKVGLKASVTERAHATVRPGRVIRQNPEAGDKINEGDTVTLFVSIGPKETLVPDLTNMTVEDARAALEKADLELGKRNKEPSEEVEGGLIIRQDPSEGLTVEAGRKVEVWVSSGPEPVTVPFVEGQSEETAINEITNEGLNPEVTRESHPDVPEGEVISQDPDGGTEASRGDTVRIVVSEGPEAQEMPNVVGEDADDAEEFLENDYGLNVSQEPETEFCEQPPGVVCRQDPEEGDEVTEGNDAILYVQPDGDVSITPNILLAIVAAFRSA